MKKCEHYWFYLNTVWTGRSDDPDSVAVGRYCGKCGEKQAAFARKWEPVPESHPDMLEQMEVDAHAH